MNHHVVLYSVLVTFIKFDMYNSKSCTLKTSRPNVNAKYTIINNKKKLISQKLTLRYYGGVHNTVLPFQFSEKCEHGCGLEFQNCTYEWEFV